MHAYAVCVNSWVKVKSENTYCCSNSFFCGSLSVSLSYKNKIDEYLLSNNLLSSWGWYKYKLFLSQPTEERDTLYSWYLIIDNNNRAIWPAAPVPCLYFNKTEHLNEPCGSHILVLYCFRLHLGFIFKAFSFNARLIVFQIKHLDDCCSNELFYICPLQDGPCKSQVGCRRTGRSGLQHRVQHSQTGGQRALSFILPAGSVDISIHLWRDIIRVLSTINTLTLSRKHQISTANNTSTRFILYQDPSSFYQQIIQHKGSRIWMSKKGTS